MEIIIVGCGKVGYELIDQLSDEGHDISVIDLNSKSVNNMSNRFDVMGVVGNGASYSVQIEAGIETANLLIAVTDSDELNLLCCLIAKKAGNCQTIARVRNPVYNQEVEFIKEELGLAMVINPEYAAASEIARILRLPSAIEINTFSKGRVELLKFKIQPGSKLHNYMLLDIRNKLQSDILICAVERGEDVFIPDGSFVLKENDVITFMTTPKNTSQFFKKIGIQTHQVKNAMLIGGGKIAFYLAMQLIPMGISVKIIEKEKKVCEHLSELLPKATIIHEDATERDILLQEGLMNAEAFVTLTNIDEENIFLALFAKKKSNAKIVAKINKIAFHEVINTLDLGSIIYPKNITADYIIQYVRAMQNTIGSNVETLYKIIDDRAEALEFNVNQNSKIIGVPLEKLKLKRNLLICGIYHKGKIIIPNGQDQIQIGDRVIVVTTNTGLNDIRDIVRN